MPAIHRTYEYDQIKHTYALDSYLVSNPYLSGHVPISHMPATWDPHAVAKSLRPSHQPVPAHERDFATDDPLDAEGIDSD